MPALAALVLFTGWKLPSSPATHSFKSLNPQVSELNLEEGPQFDFERPPSPSRRHRPQDSVSSTA